MTSICGFHCTYSPPRFTSLPCLRTTLPTLKLMANMLNWRSGIQPARKITTVSDPSAIPTPTLSWFASQLIVLTHSITFKRRLVQPPLSHTHSPTFDSSREWWLTNPPFFHIHSGYLRLCTSVLVFLSSWLGVRKISGAIQKRSMNCGRPLNDRSRPKRSEKQAIFGTILGVFPNWQLVYHFSFLITGYGRDAEDWGSSLSRM